jgi:hypothetical protein
VQENSKKIAVMKDDGIDIKNEIVRGSLLNTKILQ